MAAIPSHHWRGQEIGFAYMGHTHTQNLHIYVISVNQWRGLIKLSTQVENCHLVKY